MKNEILLLVVILFTTACSNSKQVETNLYFGLSKPGGMVSEKEWSEFSLGEVSRVFDLGFTEINTSGKWFDREKQVIITEPSILVIAIHVRNKALDNRIDSLCLSYKKRFLQQAVLRVDKKVKMKLN